MIYKPTGRKSRAWWLDGIKKNGQTSKAKMAAAMHVAQVDMTWAIRDLLSEKYIRILGSDGRGKRPKFELTELGEGYLSRNQDDLQETAGPSIAPPAEQPMQSLPNQMVVFTWKRVLGGGVKYYADGKHIAASLVPEAELARIRGELGQGKFGSDVEYQAEAEYHEGDVYTWKQPIAGPCQYFLNGEFVLQTKVPQDEMNRMLAEQGSPLLSTQESNSYRVKITETGRRLYFRNDQLIPRSEVPENQLEFLENWEPPKEGDPRLKKTRIPKHLQEDDDDIAVSMDEDKAVESIVDARRVLNDSPGSTAHINKPQGSEKLESDKNDKRKHCKMVGCACNGEGWMGHDPLPPKVSNPQPLEKPALAKATAPDPEPTPVLSKNEADKGNLDSAKATELATYPYCGTCQAPTQLSCIPEHVRHDFSHRHENYELPKTIPENPSPAEQINAAAAARAMFDQPGVAKLIRDTINEILFEKYAHTLTATEVLERLESKI